MVQHQVQDGGAATNLDGTIRGDAAQQPLGVALAMQLALVGKRPQSHLDAKTFT